MKDQYRQRLTAADVMHTEVVTVGPKTSLRDAAHRMVTHHVSGLPVIDAQNRCVGIISASDIMRFADRQAPSVANHPLFTKHFDDRTHRWEYLDLNAINETSLSATEVAEVMTRDPVSVSPWTALHEVASTMHEHMIHRILVLSEGNYLKGIISSMDFVRLASVSECEPLAVAN